MARSRLIVRTRCPLCGNHVEEVPDGLLKKEPEKHDAEMVVTRTGYKQYIHSSCWNKMIAEQKRSYSEERAKVEQKEKASQEREAAHV